GGELAAGDGDDPAGRRGDAVAAGQVGGAAAVGALHQRAQPGPGADHVGVGGAGELDGLQQVVDVVAGDGRVVEGAVVVGVGGAHVGEVPPRHDEHGPLVLRHGDDRGDVV